jgi:hypothetical protein
MMNGIGLVEHAAVQINDGMQGNALFLTRSLVVYPICHCDYEVPSTPLILLYSMIQSVMLCIRLLSTKH